MLGSAHRPPGIASPPTQQHVIRAFLVPLSINCSPARHERTTRKRYCFVQRSEYNTLTPPSHPESLSCLMLFVLLLATVGQWIGQCCVALATTALQQHHTNSRQSQTSLPLQVPCRLRSGTSSNTAVQAPLQTLSRPQTPLLHIYSTLYIFQLQKAEEGMQYTTNSTRVWSQKRYITTIRQR